jgi:hypothetical protein
MNRKSQREGVRKSRNATTPIAEYEKEELGENSYTKGAWSLYVLNQIVGDEKPSRGDGHDARRRLDARLQLQTTSPSMSMKSSGQLSSN